MSAGGGVIKPRVLLLHMDIDGHPELNQWGILDMMYDIQNMKEKKEITRVTFSRQKSDIKMGQFNHVFNSFY